MMFSRYFITALALIMVSAVLFLNCTESKSSTLLVDGRTDSAQPDSLPVAEFDSIRPLGGTGFEIDLKAGFLYQVISDSSFRIYPTPFDTGCSQSMYIDFKRGPIKVPGTRPTRNMSTMMLSQQVTLHEFRYPGNYCASRTGYVYIDSGYIVLTATAPPDQRLDRLFAVALSMRKSKDPGK